MKVKVVDILGKVVGNKLWQTILLLLFHYLYYYYYKWSSHLAKKLATGIDATKSTASSGHQMPYPKYKCAHCDYQCSAPYVVKHFRDKHADTISRSTLELNTRKSHTTGIVITLYNEAGSRVTVRCCFACEKFWQRLTLAEDHFSASQGKWKCPNRGDDHRNICGELLNGGGAGGGGADTAPIIENEMVSMEAEELRKQIAKLTADLEKAKRENKQQQADIKRLQSNCEDYKEGHIKYRRLIHTLLNTVEQETRQEFADACNELNDGEHEEIDWDSEFMTYQENVDLGEYNMDGEEDE